MCQNNGQYYKIYRYIKIINIIKCVNVLLYATIQGEELRWDKDVTFTAACQSDRGGGGCDLPVVLKSTAVGIPANKGG
jgi:hypothetical protein